MDQDFVQSFDYNKAVINTETIESLRATIKSKDEKIRELINAGELMCKSAKEGLFDRILGALFLYDEVAVAILEEQRNELVK